MWLYSLSPLQCVYWCLGVCFECHVIFCCFFICDSWHFWARKKMIVVKSNTSTTVIFAKPHSLYEHRDKTTMTVSLHLTPQRRLYSQQRVRTACISFYVQVLDRWDFSTASGTLPQVWLRQWVTCASLSMWNMGRGTPGVLPRPRWKEDCGSVNLWRVVSPLSNINLGRNAMSQLWP